MSMETKHPEQEGHRTPEEDYEHSDADVRAVLKAGFWLAILLFVVFVSMRWTFGIMGKMTPMGAPASPFDDARVMPPSPRLQVDPQLEITNYCTSQVDALTSYGWKDSQAGIVQIPVDRAIELLVEHPLPARSGGDVPVTANLEPSILPAGVDTTGPCGYIAAHAAAKKAAAEEAGKPEERKN